MMVLLKSEEPAAQTRCTAGIGGRNYFFARYLRRSSATATIMTKPCAM